MTQIPADALAPLAVLVGDWTMEARFPGDQPAQSAGAARDRARSRFEWALDGQFLLQHTEISIPDAPDSLAIVGVAPDTGHYTQHYYDSRGVARLYAMRFADGVWTLTREAPDFTPLDFRQRFTGTFSKDSNVITGTWEKAAEGGDWEHDFVLIYRRAS